MHYSPSLSSRTLTGLALAGLVVLAGYGCSKQSRVVKALAQADRDFQAGQYDQAEIEYKNVLQVDAQNPQAITNLGRIFHEQGRESRSLPFLAKAKELRPSDLTARLEFGLACLATGNIKDARDEALFLLTQPRWDEQVPLLLVEASVSPKELEEARRQLQSLPGATAGSAPILVALGQIALRENHPQEAEASFKSALAANPNSLAALSAQGMLAWSRKDLAAAEPLLKLAADLSAPRSPQRLQYAQFKLQTGDLAGGRKILDEVSRQTPDYLPAWVWLAELAAQEKKYDESDLLLGKVLARDPLHPEALLLGARIRLARGEIDKAIAELERLAGLFSKSAQINFQLGLAYAAKGDSTKALARLTQAAAAPQMTQAVLAIGELNLRKRDFGAAIAALEPLTRQHPELISARQLLAEAYRGKGNLDEAAALYATLAVEQPRDPQIAFSRGLVFLQQNHPDEARRAFLQTRELAPENFGALEQLVNLDLEAKNYASARQLVEADQAKLPQSAPHALLLAKICLAQRDNPAAEAALKRAIALQPDSPDGHFLLARLYVTARQPEKALTSLQEAVAKKATNLPALLLLGVIYQEKKDYAAARDAYEKALAVEPKASLALNNLAYLYAERLGQLDKALDMAQRARVLLPKDPRTADTLGWILVKKKQYPAGLALLQESAAKLPDEAEVSYHLGVARYLLGEEDPARAAFQRALKLDNGFEGAGDARQRLAILSLDASQPTKETRAMLEQYLAQHDDDAMALNRFAEILQKNGETDRALERFQAALQANPRNAGATVAIARIYAARGDLPKALEFAKNARSLAPSQVAITHTVGQIAFKSSDYRWAASLFDEAVRQQPENPELLFDWAEAVYSIGRISDAEAGLRRALAAHPPLALAKRAEQSLEFISASANPSKAATSATKAQEKVRSDPDNLPALFVIALASEQQSDASTAKQSYERILSRYPEFAPAQKNLVMLYSTDPVDDAKATALAAKARQSFPGDPILARAIGMIAYRQGDFIKAANLLQETATKGQKDGNLMYYLGMSQWRLNKRTESKVSLKRALELGISEGLAAEAKKNLANLE